MPDKGGGGGGGGGSGGGVGGAGLGVSTRLSLIPNFENPRVLGPSSYTALGEVLAGTGVTRASATWPTANLAIFYPFFVTKTDIIRKLYIFNGATASGNVDIGVYRDDGSTADRVTSNGGSAQTGTSILQELTCQQLDIPPGLYYLAVAFDNITATTTRYALGIYDWKACGVAQMASAYPLPKLATLAAVANDYLPFAGIGFRSLVV